MKFEDVFDDAARGFDPASVREAARLLGLVSKSIASSSLDSIGDEDLVSLLHEAEEIGRFADYIKVRLVSGVVSREGLPGKFGFKDSESMLRDVTKSSSKQVVLRLRMAEELNSRGVSAVGLPGAEPAGLPGAEPVGSRLAERFAGGKLDLESAVMMTETIDKARQVDTDLAREIENQLVQLDVHADDVRNITRNQAKEIDLQHGDDPQAARRRISAKRYFRFGREQNGLVPIFGNLMPETAAKIARAFDAINSPRTKVSFQPSDEDGLGGHRSDGTGHDREGVSNEYDGRTPDQKRHDALHTIVSFGLKNSETPMLGGEAVTLVVETTLEDLTNARGAARILDPHGYKQTVDSSLARHAACVGGILKVTTQDGRIIELESINRTFTAPQRKAIMLRDGGCVIPGCTTPATWCEIHHVKEHSRGGPTHTDNGVTLCWWHHRNIETNGWQIRMRDGKPEILRARDQKPGVAEAQNRKPDQSFQGTGVSAA